MVYIKDPLFDDVGIRSRSSPMRRSGCHRQDDRNVRGVRSGKEFHTKPLRASIDRMLEELFTNQELLVQLTDIRTDDNNQFVHALNVCMMAVLIGMNYGLNAIATEGPGARALLHDVGKVGMEEEEEDPDSKQHHTWRGFEIIKNKHEFSLMSAHIALQHHERVDGQGFLED